MKTIEQRLLRAPPNIHSHEPCFLAVVDLEDLDDVASNHIEGFTDRLVELIPSLIEHRCSGGHRGGFIKRLHEGTYMAHITEPITIEAAQRRSIPTVRLTPHDNLFQLGWGVRQQRIQATTTSQTNYIAVSIASDKELTKALLAEAGLPVPSGETVTTLEPARQAAFAIGGPVVVKPLDANQGKGVSTPVVGDDALTIAYERARAFGPRIIVEPHIEGDDFRVLVIGEQAVAAARRVPPQVIGDCHSTVRELVHHEDENPCRGDGHENVLTRYGSTSRAPKNWHVGISISTPCFPGGVPFGCAATQICQPGARQKMPSANCIQTRLRLRARGEKGRARRGRHRPGLHRHSPPARGTERRDH